MGLPEKFISCDWGTSNFRLRLVDTHSLDVLSEVKTNMGIKKRFQEFKTQYLEEQNHFFATYLKEQIKKLDLGQDQDLTVVASGMLSSSIGMQELPYVNMPIAFSGSNLISKSAHFASMPNILLISGAKTTTDVMRGEEVQAIGLSDQLPQRDQGILLLPGTHSKHIAFDCGQFEDFTTYMTGELFEILSRHSILSASLTKVDWDKNYQKTFLNGVENGLDNRQMASLFSIRANSVLHHISGDQNFYYLSGLLIGSELADLKNKSATIYLAATGVYHQLYKLALESFLPLERYTCFEAQLLEKALLIGQKKILETYD